MRALSEYIRDLEESGLLVSAPEMRGEDTGISLVTYNSKEAAPGALFVCKGAAFKKQYLEDAVKAGAAAYVSETGYEDVQAPAIIVKDVRAAMVRIALMYFGPIHERIRIIAVTGTKGKTTTCYILKKIFDAWLAGKGQKPAAFMTSIEMYDGEETRPSVNTTPEIFESYGFLKRAAENGLTTAIMEVSSQGLKYGRVAGLKFSAGILLNLSPDHVSPIEHPDLDDYYASKLSVFAQSSSAIVNLDSDHAEEMIRASATADSAWMYGTRRDADYRIYEVYEEDGHSFFTLYGEGEEHLFELGLRGTFNIENAVAAIVAGRLHGIPFSLMKEVLKNVSIPGRGEEFSTKDKKIAVIVDYAHNELSCRKVIESAKKSWPDRKIITIFGCTGGKALNRREGMGRTISALSDFICLTEDDPGPEDVSEICREVAGYIDGCAYQIITDREEAIRRTFGQIDSEAVLLVLGKGCETAQKVGKTSVPYPSDPVIVRECIREYDSRNSGR